MILTKIIEEKRKEIENSKKKISVDELLAMAESLKTTPKNHSFKHSINKPHKISLIGEVKKASPSAGVLREDFDPVKIASTYEANGASAISVLTDEKFFHGHIDHLKNIKKNVTIPVLRKDFIIDEFQIYESAAAGADAALLIADFLSEEELKRFIDIGRRFHLDFLVEVHSEEDVKKAVESKCEIIGLNNRDLHTFKVDMKTTQRLLRIIPEGKIIVAESGIKTREDISYLKSLNVNAVLIGEVFMRAADIGEKVRELMG